MSRAIIYRFHRKGSRPKGDPHAKACECSACLTTKVREYESRIKRMAGELPPSPEHTIPVKPHWRKNSNHLRKSPELRSLVRDIVAGLLADSRKRVSK